MSSVAHRRPLALLVGAVVCALALSMASCSSDSDQNDDPAAATGAYPVTVQTATGDTTIGKKPERVVTLGNPAFENALALGIDPVGASVNNIENLPYLADHAKDKAIDNSLANAYANEINYEAILALTPDLIVAPAWPQFDNKTVVAKLEQIAPTLIFDMQDAKHDWRVGIRQVAKAFGKTDKGEQLIAQAVNSFSAVGAKHPALATKPYSFGLYYKSDIMLGGGGNILRLFGMQPAADQIAVEDEAAHTVYSGETAGDVKGRIVLLLPSPRNSAAQLEASPAWAGNLSERVVWLSDAQGEAINNAGILGKAWVANDLDATFTRLG
ncbi:putative periplasmic binding protein [Nocardia nova SH22a]|uniref:Putative periplasmic binding protein n=1 Tax=Nocardia nova SH22a TaxID=1415166 RepID=W5TGB4_9NOCA|nr:ABC transporter substrate-binding protein [Nocardia nova]AHH18360.1 putative periplasmic binding protein [Nocardia nova SH22a]